jgi:hypothetical protein
VTRRTEALVLAAIVIAVSLPFASSVAFGFTFDDANTILRHRGVAGPLSVDDLLLRDFWGRSHVNTIGSWRPAVTLGYWVDWHLGGGQPWLFHLHNIGLYAALVVVQALFLQRFFGEALGQVSRLVAVGTAGALAIHADVVPSATGGAEIVAALFGLLALLAPLREHGPLRLREVLLTTGACILAAGAKESALPVALLAPLLAYRWHAARGPDRRRGMIALAAANAVALAAIVAFRVLRMPWWDLGPERATENSLLAASPGVRLAGAAEVLVGYLQRLVWPARLAPDYSYAGIVPGHAPALAAIGVAVAGLVFAVGLMNWKRAPGLSDAVEHDRPGERHRRPTLLLSLVLGGDSGGARRSATASEETHGRGRPRGGVRLRTGLRRRPRHLALERRRDAVHRGHRRAPDRRSLPSKPGAGPGRRRPRRGRGVAAYGGERDPGSLPGAHAR